MQQEGSYDYLKTITQSTLVVNGSNDVIMPTVNSFIMEQNIPNAQLIIYPDSNHGSQFQYPSCSSAMCRCSFPRKAQRDRSYARSAREFLGGDRGCGAHPVDECGTRNDVPAIRLGMESDPYGDDGDLRGVSDRRCRCADIVWRHLDYIGRRATILIGLTSSLLGTALFAVAPSVLWVFVGRAFMGLGVGLCAGSATRCNGGVQRGRTGDARVPHHLAQAMAIAQHMRGALIQRAQTDTEAHEGPADEDPQHAGATAKSAVPRSELVSPIRIVARRPM